MQAYSKGMWHKMLEDRKKTAHTFPRIRAICLSLTCFDLYRSWPYINVKYIFISIWKASYNQYIDEYTWLLNRHPINGQCMEDLTVSGSLYSMAQVAPTLFRSLEYAGK